MKLAMDKKRCPVWPRVEEAKKSTLCDAPSVLDVQEVYQKWK